VHLRPEMDSPATSAGDSSAVVDSLVSSASSTGEGDAQDTSTPTASLTAEEADHPPAIEMRESDVAMEGASGQDPTPDSRDQAIPDAPSPALSSPLSAPTPPQAASAPASPPLPPPPLYDLPAMIETAASTSNFASLLLRLEDIELEASDGVAPSDVYECMMVVNLILNDIVSAKLLWKRIPPQIKRENLEMEHLWRVGTKLWAGNYETVFADLSRKDWSPFLQPLITCLSHSIRARVLTLIEKSYESLRLTSMTLLLGLANQDSQMTLASERQWRIAQGFAYPAKRETTTASGRVRAEEDGLGRLTDYVAFLEE